MSPQYNRPEKVKENKPDDFVSFFDHVVRYFEIHQKKLYALVLVVILGFMGYGVYLYWQSRQVTSFAQLYSKAMQTPESESLKYWQELQKKSAPRHLKELIDLQVGGIYAQGQKWPEAIAEFEKATSSSSKVLKNIAELAVATSLENAGQFDQALKRYQQMSEQTDHPFRERAKLGMAQCYLSLGKKVEGQQLLQQLSNTSQHTAAMQALLVSKMNP